MGNSSVATTPQNNQTQLQTERSSKFQQTGSTFASFPIYRNSQSQLFIGREIDLPETYAREIMLQNMQIAQKATAVLHIQHFEFRSVSTVCSQQQKCLLLSKKPEQTLQNMYNSRKAQKQSFRASQISSIISRIALALQAQQTKQFNLQLDLESIVFLQGKAYLVNSLIYDGDRGPGQIFGRFRAPETMGGNYDFEEGNSWLCCQLFALGVIGLCLTFININIEALLYYKTQKASRKGISQVQISVLLERIKNPTLAHKLRTLLCFNPKTREGIFGLIMEDRKEAVRKDRDLQPANDFRANDKNIHQKSHVNENKAKESTIRLNNKSIIFREITAPKIDIKNVLVPLNATNIPFLAEKSGSSSYRQQSQLHNNKVRSQAYSIIITAPEKIKVVSYNLANKQNVASNLAPKSQLKPQIAKRNDSSSLVITTPQKQTKKRQFSTIKQVTEYDNSASVHKQMGCTNGKYDGNEVDGKKQGYGVFYFDEGSRYEGEWKNNKMHGFGKLYYYDDKLAYQGHWIEGEFHGYGKVYNCDILEIASGFNYADFGSLGEEWVSYEGQLQHDKREGRGVLKLSNGQRFQGEFSDDMVQGKGTFYTLSKGLIRGIWSKSRLVSRDML